MKLTILGSGTSQGVPIIGCQCEVCRSKDPRDIRLRSSVMVEWRGVRIVVDAGPDFRLQMLREGVRQIDALLLTHHHQDHAGGIDDTRALTFVDYPIIRRLQLYATAETIGIVKRHYDYAFAENKYLGVPEIDLHEIVSGERFKVSSEDEAKGVETEAEAEGVDVETEAKGVEVETKDVNVEAEGVEVEAIRGTHAKGLEVTGYRFGDVAYLTDFKEIESSERDRLRGLKVLVVNALRWSWHYSHFSVEEALELIADVKPERAYLTHLSHDIGRYDEVAAKLPDGVMLAYDGLQIEL